VAWGWLKRKKKESLPEDRGTTPLDRERYRALPDEEPPALGVTTWEGWVAFGVAVLLAIGAVQLFQYLKENPKQPPATSPLRRLSAPPVPKADMKDPDDPRAARARMLFEAAEREARALIGSRAEPGPGGGPSGRDIPELRFSAIREKFKHIEQAFGDAEGEALEYARRAKERREILDKLLTDEAMRVFNDVDSRAKLAAMKGKYDEAAEIYAAFPKKYYERDLNGEIGPREYYDNAMRLVQEMRSLQKRKDDAETPIVAVTTHMVVDFEIPANANLVPALGTIQEFVVPPPAPLTGPNHVSTRAYQAFPRLGRAALTVAHREDGYFAVEKKEMLAFQYMISDKRSEIIFRLHARRAGKPIGIFEFRMRPEAANEWKLVQLKFSRMKLVAKPKAPSASEKPELGDEDFWGGGEFDLMGGGDDREKTRPDALAPRDIVTEWEIVAEPAPANLEFYLDNIFFTTNDLDHEFRRRIGWRVPRHGLAPR